MGWSWTAGGGHCTVCVGPTKSGTQAVILDPGYGLQYISLANPFTYSPTIGGVVQGTGNHAVGTNTFLVTK